LQSVVANFCPRILCSATEFFYWVALKNDRISAETWRTHKPYDWTQSEHKVSRDPILNVIKKWSKRFVISISSAISVIFCSRIMAGGNFKLLMLPVFLSF
jgi:hypothetical protein